MRADVEGCHSAVVLAVADHLGFPRLDRAGVPRGEGREPSPVVVTDGRLTASAEVEVRTIGKPAAPAERELEHRLAGTGGRARSVQRHARHTPPATSCVHDLARGKLTL